MVPEPRLCVLPLQAQATSHCSRLRALDLEVKIMKENVIKSYTNEAGHTESICIIVSAALSLFEAVDA